MDAISSAAMIQSSISNLGASVNIVNQISQSINVANISINAAANAQQKLNGSMEAGQSIAGKLWNGIKNIGSSIDFIASGKKVLELSDTLAQNTAKLNTMNDGLQTTDQLQQMIYRSAQDSRASYLDTADVVTQLGTGTGGIFKNNAETVAFAEQLNKQFTLAGASQDGMKSATSQLAQAFSSGALSGEEFNAIYGAAPNLMQSLADYMNVPIGQLQQMASQGQISASTIKNAMFASADETNAKFNSMPMTWSQIWTGAMNDILRFGQPLLDFISFLAQNWSVLEPIVLGVAAALIVYNASMGIAWLSTLQTAAATVWKTICDGAETAAILGLTLVQDGFNAALALCPLTWIIIAIIAIIAIIYAVVAAINKAQGTAISATGIICGAVMFVVAAVGNQFIALYNFFIGIIIDFRNGIATLAEFFMNVWTDPINSVGRLFVGFGDYCLGIIENIANAVDTVFGQNLSGTVAGWRKNLHAWSDETFGKAQHTVERLDKSKYLHERIDNFAAYNNGYNWGKGLDDKVSNAFKMPEIPKAEDYTKSVKPPIKPPITPPGVPPATDPSLLGAAQNTAANTGKMADSMALSQEDLKYMRDLAELETVNRFTTVPLTMNFHNNNNVSSDMDLDGMISSFAQRAVETLDEVALGVNT